MSLKNRASGGQAVYFQVITKGIRDIRKDSFPAGLPWVTSLSLDTPRLPKQLQITRKSEMFPPKLLSLCPWFKVKVKLSPCLVVLPACLVSSFFFFSFLGIFPKSSYAFSLTLVFASCRISFSFCNGHFQDCHNFCLLHSLRTYNRVRFPFFTLQCWYFQASILIQFLLLHVWVGGSAEKFWLLLPWNH